MGRSLTLSISQRIHPYVRDKESYIYILVDWAALNGRCDVIEYLIANGANANLKNDFDHLPLEGAL